jgi:hypothetical protein
MKTVFVVLCLVVMGAGIGCASFSEWVTPAHIDQQAVGYVVGAGVAEPNEFGGYPNLSKAEALAGKVDAAHQVVQLSLQQKLQKDDLEYGLLKDTVAASLTLARQREEALFGEKGLLTMGLGIIGAGSLAGFVGLMRKRPGDITSAEMNDAIAQATGQSAEIVAAKTKQFAQLVQSVNAIFGDLGGMPETVKKLKSLLDGIQDTDTQIAVQSVKKELNL